MKNTYATAALCAIVFAAALSSVAAENLLKERNGDFENELTYWLIDFPDHDFLKDNDKFVTVTEDGTRKNVLKFTVSQVATDNWGVQALSYPIRIDAKKRYKLTVAARSTGPAGRIYVMGKRWKPGVKKSNTPSNADVRDAFKGPVLSFSGEEGTAQFSNVKRTWATESVEIPQRDLSELAYNFWENCDFVVIHLVGIGGKGGDFFVDDVKLEEVGPVDRSQIKKGK